MANGTAGAAGRGKQGGGAGPDAREYVRLGLIGAVVTGGAVACYIAQWWVLAVLLTLLAVVFWGGCYAVGALFARFIVAPKPSSSSAQKAGPGADGKRSGKKGGTVRRAVLDLGAMLFTAHDAAAERAARADLAARGLDPDDPVEKQVDRAVGPMLALLPPADDAFARGMGAQARTHLRDERLEERERTWEWLEGDVPAWELVGVEAEDGVSLAGHVLRAHPEGGCWALLVHGYRGTWRETIQYARRWAAEGYNLLAVEQRAHGRSGGAWTGMGWLERRDVAVWCHWLAEGGAGAPCGEIVLHGHSMGAATVALASAEPDLPACTRAAVVDCAFSSAWAAFTWSLDHVGMPARPSLDLMRLYLLTKRGGYDIVKADAVPALAKPGLPVLFVHGEDDPLVPVEMTRRLYAEANRTKRLLLVPGAGHCQAVLADGDGYFAAVRSFLEECR